MRHVADDLAVGAEVRVTSTRRSMIVGIVTGASMALGIVGGVVALMKALGL
jgi:hypothetical protein